MKQTWDAQPLNEAVVIETPYNVAIEYEAASIGRRIAAAVFDGFILLGYFLFIYRFGAFDIPSLWPLLMVPYVFYNFWCEAAFNGQTVGKFLTGLRVVKLDGTPPGLGDYFMRWILLAVDGFPFMFTGLPLYLVGLFVSLSNKTGRRLGDVAAGTVVIRLRFATTFTETIYRNLGEDYAPVFPQVARLNDKDMAIINEIFQNAIKNEDPLTLKRLSDKIKEVIQVETRIPDEYFIRKIIQDYNYVTGQEEE